MRGIELKSPCCDAKDEYLTVTGIHKCSECEKEFIIYTETWSATPKVMRLKIDREEE